MRNFASLLASCLILCGCVPLSLTHQPRSGASLKRATVSVLPSDLSSSAFYLTWSGDAVTADGATVPVKVEISGTKSGYASGIVFMSLTVFETELRVRDAQAVHVQFGESVLTPQSFTLTREFNLGKKSVIPTKYVLRWKSGYPGTKQGDYFRSRFNEGPLMLRIDPVDGQLPVSYQIRDFDGCGIAQALRNLDSVVFR